MYVDDDDEAVDGIIFVMRNNFRFRVFILHTKTFSSMFKANLIILPNISHEISKIS